MKAEALWDWLHRGRTRLPSYGKAGTWLLTFADHHVGKETSIPFIGPE
jgi:hypothetical protein